MQNLQRMMQVRERQLRIRQLRTKIERQRSRVEVINRLLDSQRSRIEKMKNELEQQSRFLKVFKDSYNKELDKGIILKNQLVGKKTVIRALLKLNRYLTAEIFFNVSAIHAFNATVLTSTNKSQVQFYEKYSSALGMLAFLFFSVAKVYGLTLANQIKPRGSRTSLFKGKASDPTSQQLTLFVTKETQFQRIQGARRLLQEDMRMVVQILGLCKGKLKNIVTMTQGLQRFLFCRD